MSIFDYGYVSASGKPTLSMSKISTYLTCSVKATALYGQGENRIPIPNHRSSAKVGNILHAVFEHHLTNPAAWPSAAYQYVADSPLMPGLTAALFEKQYNLIKTALAHKPWLKAPSFKNPLLQKIDAQVGACHLLDQLTPAEFMDQLVVSLIRAEGMSIHTKYAACELERKFDYDDEALPWAFAGTADLFYRQGDAVFIGDYKTGADNWSLAKVRNSPQFNFYAFLARKEFDLPDSVPVVVTVLALKSGTEYTVKLGLPEAVRFKEWLSAALEIVAATQQDGLKVVPGDSNLSCPCDVGRMGQCPYKDFTQTSRRN